MTVPLTDSEKDARLIARLKYDLQRVRAERDKFMKRQGMSFEAVVDDFRLFLEKDDTFKNFIVRPSIKPAHKLIGKPPVDKRHSEIASLILSDLHVSERIKLQDVNFINSFNSLVCANRLYDTIDTFKTLVRLHQSMYKIDEIWVPILGDIISGTIQVDALLTNDLSDVAASILAFRLLKLAILELKTLGIHIRIDTANGNHSRQLVKQPLKEQARLCYDWMIYEALAAAFEGDPQVEVHVHTGQLAIVERYSHRFALEHGIGVRHGEEEDLEAVLRNIFDSPIYRNATGLKGTSLDTVIIGDLHRAQVGERYIVNGCLPGQNELGMSWRLSPIGSIQQSFGISRNRRMTWHYPIETTGNRSEKADNVMSEYATLFLEKHGR